MHKGIDDGEDRNLFNDVLAVVRARRTFLGAHLTVDVWNNFQSKSHVTEFTGEIEQKPKLLVEFTNLSQNRP